MHWSIRDKTELILGYAVITAAVIAAFKYVFPIVSPFVLAYGLAIVIEKPVKKLSIIFRGRKTAAGIVIVVIIGVLVLLGTACLVKTGVREIANFVKNSEYYMIFIKQKIAVICFEMDKILGLQDGESLRLLSGFIERIGQTNGNGVTKTVKDLIKLSVPVVVKLSLLLAGFIVMLMATVYFLNRLNNIRSWKERTVFKTEVKYVSFKLKILFSVYFRVQLIILAINSLLCVGGIAFIGNNYAAVIGIIIGILDAFPFFGTGTVLVPWAVIEALSGKYKNAIILMIIYLVTYFVREIMESKCMGDRTGVSPIVMLIVIFAGILVYGVAGVITGPVSFVIIKALADTLKMELESDKLKKCGVKPQ